MLLSVSSSHPRPQVTFQDEDDSYAYVDSAYVQVRNLPTLVPQSPHPCPVFPLRSLIFACVSACVQLTSFWHQYTVNLAVPYRLRGHNIVTNVMLGG